MLLNIKILNKFFASHFYILLFNKTMSETYCQMIYKKVCCCFIKKNYLKTFRVSIDQEKNNYDDSVTQNTMGQNNNKDMHPNDISMHSNDKNVHLNNELDKDIELLNNDNSELKNKIQEFTLQSESINNYGNLHSELSKKAQIIKKLQEDIHSLQEVGKKLNQPSNDSDPLLNSGRFKKIQAYSVPDEEKQQIDSELKSQIEVLEYNLKNEKEKVNAFTANNSKMSNDLKNLFVKII